jgi:hypothetical protein
MNSHTSSQRASASVKLLLPKGWVYTVEDISIKTEAEVANPSSYLMLDTPLTHLKHKCQLEGQHADPYCQHHQALNTTKALLTSLSTSEMTTVVKHQHITSVLTLTPQTLS